MVSKTNKIRNAKMKIRKFKKKANPFKIDKVPYIDYKDITLLQSSCRTAPRFVDGT